MVRQWALGGDSLSNTEVHGGVKSLGRHVIVELWGCKNIDSLPVVEEALRDAVAATNATLRDLQVFPWEPYNGVSGIAILSESHLSIHTWPELGYAAVDIFTCGDHTQPEAAVPVLREYFHPERMEVMQVSRGLIVD
jgi:S-adenosylmethionine decarboxylase